MIAPTVSDEILKDMRNIDQFLTITKHNNGENRVHNF